MSKPVIGITGANGFIGASLARFLHQEEFPVIEFGRNNDNPGILEKRKFDLKLPFESNLFAGIDILIHCALSKDGNACTSGKTNYEGSKKLFESAKAQGVKKIIFFSSVSAHERARSQYGKNKYRLHNLLDLSEDVILQCGLVIGDGGLFKKLLDHALRKRFIPMIGNGRQIMQLIVIDDLQNFVLRNIQQEMSGRFIIANNECLSFRQLFKISALIFKKPIYTVPVPAFLLQLAINISIKLKLNIPVSSENLDGLRSIIYLQPSEYLADGQNELIKFRDKLLQMRNRQLIR